MIEKIVPAIVSLDIKPPNAMVVFTARVMFDPKGPVYEYRKMMLFKVQADLIKEGDSGFSAGRRFSQLIYSPPAGRIHRGNPGEILN